MLLNFITWNVKPQIVTLGSFEIRWYSILFATGFILGYIILSKIFKKEGVPIELLDKLTIYVVLGTIIGARLGHCLFYEPEYFLKHPWRIILPWEGTIGKDFKFTGYQGLASHGGAIGIILALYLFSRKYKKPYLWILDRLVIVTALAGFFIRMGNLMNSEVYGIPTKLPWGFKFMREALYGVPVSQIVPKHPTQIYEGLAYLLVFFLLLYLYRKYNGQFSQGFLFALFLILVFTARFFIEYVKENQESFESHMPLDMGQLLSIPFILAGIIILIVISRKKKITT
jgi:phosphatidylglycerol---prolipoprotein diacylglyceryl transferase